MKKKIFIFFAFLMMVLCLTGCSTKVSSDKIRKMTEIAENIKNTPKYELPKGYTYEPEDGGKSGQITIITSSNKFSLSDKIRMTFDISGEKVELLQIEESYNDVIIEVSFVGGLIGVIFTIIVLVVDIQLRCQKNK